MKIDFRFHIAIIAVLVLFLEPVFAQDTGEASFKQSSPISATPVLSGQPAVISADAINVGKQLFVGGTRFVNAGPACNSCHNVKKLGIISGGALAKDLTDIPTRMDYQGTKAIITGMLSGTPAMQQSFENKPLTEEEIAALSAFLSNKSEDKTVAAIGTSGIMLWTGIIGGLGLLFLYSFFWIKRKQRTVNYSIYKRQLKST